MNLRVPAPGGPTRGMIRRPRRGFWPWLLLFAPFAAVVIACWPLLSSLWGEVVGEARVHLVEGRVEDDSTHVGIPDAEVRIVSYRAWGFRLNPAVRDFYRDTVRTDPAGTFHLRTRLASTTEFTARKDGYLLSSAPADPTVPVTIPMFKNFADRGRPHFREFPSPDLRTAFVLDLQDGFLGPEAALYDVRVSTNADSTVTIAAGPGRHVQWRPLVMSDSRWFPGALNACEAPEDGYADFVAIPPGADGVICFVRRDDGPSYGAFTLQPMPWLSGSEQGAWRRRLNAVFNSAGGRGLCTERSIVLLR